MNFRIQFIVPSLAIKLLTALVKMVNYDSNHPRDFMHFHVNSIRLSFHGNYSDELIFELNNC